MRNWTYAANMTGTVLQSGNNFLMQSACTSGNVNAELVTDGKIRIKKFGGFFGNSMAAAKQALVQLKIVNQFGSTLELHKIDVLTTATNLGNYRNFAVFDVNIEVPENCKIQIQHYATDITVNSFLVYEIVETGQYTQVSEELSQNRSDSRPCGLWDWLGGRCNV